MLKSVHFEGIKSLLNVSIDLERFTVLVGPNGCGKSTVLDQIALLSQMTVSDGKAHSLGGAAAVLHSVARDTLPTRSGGGPLVWQLTSASGGTLCVRMPDVVVPNWYERGTVTVGAREELTLRAGGVTADVLAKFNLALGLVAERSQRLRLLPGAVSAPSPVAETIVQPDGSGVATVLLKLGTNDPDALRELKVDMQLVVPQFENLRVDTEKAVVNGQQVDVCKLSLKMRGAGTLPATACSDGTLLALALLTATHNRDLPALILMDDIDHGLHLTAQYQIVEAIRRVMKVREDLQVVCTSHSPILLDAFEPEEVRVMALDKEGHTVVRKLTDHPKFERLHKALQTGEFWASTGEEWVTDGAAAGK